MTHLTTEDLDLLHLRALPPERAARVAAHLETCTGCRAEKEALEQSAAQFSQYVLPRTIEKVERRGRRGLWSQDLLWRGWLPLAALASLALVVGLRVAGSRDREDYVGVRGGASWTVVVARGDVQRKVEPKTALREGDRLRFVVDPGTATHLLILSVDGAGQRSVYFPPESTHSAPLAQGRQELPGSIELDATPGPERLYAIFSTRAVAADALFPLLGRNAEALGPEVADVLELEIHKERR